MENFHKYLFKLMANNKKLFIYCMASSAIVVLIYTLFIYKPSYSTNVDLFIRNMPSGNYVTEGDPSLIKSESGFSNPLFNFTAILKSEELSSRCLKSLTEAFPEDVKKIYSKRKNWHTKFSKIIKVKITASSDVMNVSLNWPNKKNAAEALNIIVNEFKKYNLEIRKSVNKKQREYLDKQLVVVSTKLDTLREAILKYQITNNTYSIENEEAGFSIAGIDLIKQAETLKAELKMNRKKLSVYAYQLGVPSVKSALRSTSIGQDDYLQKLLSGLAAADEEYAKLSSQFTDNYPDVITLKNRISMLKTLIEERKRETLGHVVISRGIYDKASQDLVEEMAITETKVLSTRAQLIAVEKSIKTITDSQKSTVNNKTNLLKLQKQAEALAVAYTKLKEKDLDALIKENEIVDNITQLGAPDKAKYLFFLLFAKVIAFVAIGYISASCIAWIKEELEDKWCNAEEIEELLGKKIVGILPWTEKDVAPSVVLKETFSILTMAFHNTSNRIVTKAHNANIKVMTFISTVNERRRSFISQNLFTAMAKSERSTILVDMDLTAPSKLIKDLGFNAFVNDKDIIKIIDYINSKLRSSTQISELEKQDIAQFIEKAIIRIPISNEKEIYLNYICASSVVNETYDYIASPGFKYLIDHLKSVYDFVMIDTPDKSFVHPETQVILNVADAAVVLSALDSKRKDLINLVKNIESLGHQILGIVAREVNSDLEKGINPKDKFSFSSLKDNLFQESKK